MLYALPPPLQAPLTSWLLAVVITPLQVQATSYIRLVTITNGVVIALE